MDLHEHNEDLVDVSELVGPYTWGLLHQAVETFPCPPCAESGGKLMRGLHDVVNFHIGKPVVFPEDLSFLREAVNSVETGMRSPLDQEVMRLAKQVGVLSAGIPSTEPKPASAELWSSDSAYCNGEESCRRKTW